MVSRAFRRSSSPLEPSNASWTSTNSLTDSSSSSQLFASTVSPGKLSAFKETKTREHSNQTRGAMLQLCLQRVFLLGGGDGPNIVPYRGWFNLSPVHDRLSHHIEPHSTKVLIKSTLGMSCYDCPGPPSIYRGYNRDSPSPRPRLLSPDCSILSTLYSITVTALRMQARKTRATLRRGEKHSRYFKDGLIVHSSSIALGLPRLSPVMLRAGASNRSTGARNRSRESCSKYNRNR